MKTEQQNDAEMLSAHTKHPEIYSEKEVGNVPNLLCCIKPGNDPVTQWKVELQRSMVKSSIKW